MQITDERLYNESITFRCNEGTKRTLDELSVRLHIPISAIVRACVVCSVEKCSDPCSEMIFEKITEEGKSNE